MIPGVLGCAQSPELESFEGELLDYPQFTRPREFRGMPVPEVLMSGNHGAVARWRDDESRRLTDYRRRLHEADLGHPPETPRETSSELTSASDPEGSTEPRPDQDAPTP